MMTAVIALAMPKRCGLGGREAGIVPIDWRQQGLSDGMADVLMFLDSRDCQPQAFT